MTNRALSALTLFLSASTLVCCALPALLVAVGLGSTLVALLGVFPQLIWLSENKALLFLCAGGCLLISAIVRATSSPACPSDPDLAASCVKVRKWSTVVFWVSVFLYLVGGFFAFVAPLFMQG
jgi:hypothetical protein